MPGTSHGMPHISIHAPRTGSDAVLSVAAGSSTFQSTLPARGATPSDPARRSRERISIHAPRTGSDRSRRRGNTIRSISIHAPRTGSDETRRMMRRVDVEFQSTLPARGATYAASLVCSSWLISIHAPRTGSDTSAATAANCTRYFNPRSPHGERRGKTRPARTSGTISIHAPRTGSDARRYRAASYSARFQSTLPARGATATAAVLGGEPVFQSTLPARGATWRKPWRVTGGRISIHAPRTGSDYLILSYFISGDNFNPRSPHGERHEQVVAKCVVLDFNPRSPHGERLRKVTILSIRIIGFAQKVYHKTVLLRISLAENAVILPEKPRNPVRTSLQKAGGLRFARAIRAARPYSISSPSGA